MPRAKVSVAIDTSVLDEVDRHVERRHCSSRSHAVQDALKLWLQEERKKEVEAYYDSLSAEEREESSSWDELAGQAFKELSKPSRKSRSRNAAENARPKKRRT